MLELLLLRRKATAKGWRASLRAVSFGYEVRLGSNEGYCSMRLVGARDSNCDGVAQAFY